MTTTSAAAAAIMDLQAGQPSSSSTSLLSSSLPTGSCLWCTLVMCNDSYVPGAIVTAASVHRHSRHPIRCLVTPYSSRYSLPGVSPEAIAALRRHFDDVIEVSYIGAHVVEESRSRRQKQLYGKWMRYSFTKWHVLDPNLFGQYRKIMFIDSDCILLDNVDELFDLDPPAMTLSSPWASSGVTEGNPYGNLTHGQEVNALSLREGLSSSFVGIANMVLLSPSAAAWNRFKYILERHEGRAYGHDGCWSGADEQILADIFLDLNLTVRHIHQSFNWIVGKHDWLPQRLARTWHYHGGKKPWEYSRTEHMQWPDLEVWWKLADSVIKNDESSVRWFNS